MEISFHKKMPSPLHYISGFNQMKRPADAIKMWWRTVDKLQRIKKTTIIRVGTSALSLVHYLPLGSFIISIVIAKWNCDWYKSVQSAKIYIVKHSSDNGNKQYYDNFHTQLLSERWSPSHLHCISNAKYWQYFPTIKSR